MKLLVIRHAAAESREASAASGRDDAERPLTELGRQRMRQAAKALQGMLPKLDVLATSPLLRAVETAEGLAQVYADPAPVKLQELVPGHSPSELAQWLRTHDADATVAVIGHEPDLSEAITWFVSGLSTPFLSLGKGGACLIEFPGLIEGGRAVLIWALRPSQLRGLR